MNWNFNSLLDIATNPNEIFENDDMRVNLNTEEIFWKAGRYTPKMANNVRYHLKVRNSKK